MTKIIQDIILLYNQYSEIEKEKFVLEKKLCILEFDSQKNENKFKEYIKENNELETENIGAIYFEIENMRKLILDYDNKLLVKKKILKKLQNDIRNLGDNTRICLENGYEIQLKNKLLQRELEDLKEELKKNKNNATSINMFKSNIITNEKEIHKLERPRRECINNSYTLNNKME